MATSNTKRVRLRNRTRNPLTLEFALHPEKAGREREVQTITLGIEKDTNEDGSPANELYVDGPVWDAARKHKGIAGLAENGSLEAWGA